VGVRGVREGEAEDEGGEEGEREEEEDRGADKEESLAGEGEDEEVGVRGEGGEESDDGEGEGDEEDDGGEDRGIHRHSVDDRGLGDAGGGSEDRGEGSFAAEFTSAEETEVPGFDYEAEHRAQYRLPAAGVDKSAY